MKAHSLQILRSPSGRSAYVLDGLPLIYADMPVICLGSNEVPKLEARLLLDWPTESLQVSEERIDELYGPGESLVSGNSRRAGRWWRSWFGRS